jgi:type II secretory ATPase GspE/PulE/Tfp pilus assembly ATPase PilB-like protein
MYIGEPNMICKICKEEKIKEPVIRKDTTRFVDHNSKLWNGKVCPDCYKIYNKDRMRKKRSEKIKELDI